MATTMNEIHPDTTAPVDETPQPHAAARPAPRAGRLGDDVVRWAEFRLAMWMGGFALAVIIGSQGFMYSAILGLKDDIGGLHGEIGGLRAEMQRQNGELRVEMQELRLDVQTQIGELRTEMQTQFGELRERIGELRERMVRIETHLGIEAAADRGS